MPRLTTIALVPFALTACGERDVPPPPPQNPPDALLRDSLGLDDGDQVFRVVLSTDGGENRIDPAVVVVPRGGWLEFVATDGWPRTVTFVLDSLPSPAAELLRSTGQDASPPLLDPGARFIVAFRGAPAGRYPYRVQGSARPVEGVVIVQEPGQESRSPDTGGS